MKNRLIALGLGITTTLLASTAMSQSLSDKVNYVIKNRKETNQQQIGAAAGSGMLGTLLYTDISPQFDEQPARSVFNYLQTLLGVKIVGRYSDDRTGEGIDPTTPITLNVTNQPALIVLEQVLDQCQEFEECTWQLRTRGGFIEVGTKGRLAKAKERRYYNIRDLLFDPIYFNNAPEIDLSNAFQQGGGGGRGGGGGGGFGGGGSGGGSGRGGIFGDPEEIEDRKTPEELAEELTELIQELIEPDQWFEQGGDWASIKHYQGTFIVNAPDFVHRQLAGYPFAATPVRQTSAAYNSRYVTFTGGVSNVEVTETKSIGAFGGAAGGN